MTPVQPAADAPPGVNIKAQLRQFFAYDARALRILLACVLAMVSSALEPPFLALTSEQVQALLRAPESRAPLLTAIGYLVLAMVTLIGGTTGDLFGRRGLMLAGLAGIVATNVLGAFTVGTFAHIPIYVVNVVSVGFVVPMAVATVTLAFEPAVRPFAFGMLFGAQGLALLLSSTLKWLAGLSGVLWWAFVPVAIAGIVAFWLTVRYVPESDSSGEVHPTSAWVNVALLAVTFVLIFVLLAGGTLLSNWLLPLIALGALVVVGVTGRWWIQRLAYYLNTDLDTSMFTGRDLVLAIVAGIVISAVQVAFLFEFGTFSREVQGTSSFVSYLRFVPYALGVLVGSAMIQRLTVRFGAPMCIASGMALMAFSMLALAFIRPETPFWIMLLPIVILGFGFGVATPARAQIILSAPPITLVGASAAINTAAGQLGNALGVTTASVVITELANTAYLAALQVAGVGRTVLDQVRAALPSAVTQAAEAGYAWPEVTRQIGIARYADAWMSGWGQLFMGLGVATLIAAAVIYMVMVRPGRGRGLVADVPLTASTSSNESDTAP